MEPWACPPWPVWRSIARSAAAAFVIEASSPKISGVTATESLKDLTLEAFVQSSYYIYDTLIELPSYRDCVPLGEPLLKLMRSVLEDPSVGTNTCLGYGMTIIPMASSLLYSLRAGSYANPETGVLAGYGKLVRCLREEPPELLLKSIEAAGPSYHGKYYTSRKLKSVYDVLAESAPWDLVARNIVGGFRATLDVYRCVRSKLTSGMRDAVSRCYRLAAGELLDSISFKSGGLMTSRFVQVLASSGMDDGSVREVLVGRLGVNLGSVSDIVASAVALVMIEDSMRVLA